MGDRQVGESLEGGAQAGPRFDRSERTRCRSCGPTCSAPRTPATWPAWPTEAPRRGWARSATRIPRIVVSLPALPPCAPTGRPSHGSGDGPSLVALERPWRFRHSSRVTLSAHRKSRSLPTPSSSSTSLHRYRVLNQHGAQQGSFDDRRRRHRQRRRAPVARRYTRTSSHLKVQQLVRVFLCRSTRSASC